MKQPQQQETPSTRLKPAGCPMSQPQRPSAKPKDQSPKTEAIPKTKTVPSTKGNTNTNSKSLLLEKPKSVGDQFTRPRRATAISNTVDKLREELGCSEALVKELRSQILGLRAELDGARSLNVELESLNRKLNQELTSAQAKIAALASNPDQVQKRESTSFKDIQKLIANKLEHPKVTIKEATTTLLKTPACLIPKDSGKETTAPVVSSSLPSHPPPPPPPLPPPPPPRPSANAATTIPKARFPVALGHAQCYNTRQERDKKPTAINLHSSIVGEIQNRSAHLLAIKADVETKGEFINSLIHKVLAAAYTDIEDVLKFVDWLDSQLSSLADERAVLKHFKWPERKADAMREAAIEYRDLKLLDNEISSYEDDTSIPCAAALKRMAGLLDKSERSIQRLIKLRNSVMRSYQECKIPIDWMLDSGIMCKIKQDTMKLATMYIKRVGTELQSARSLAKESAQEALLLQGMHFANRANQFAGGLDSETLCAFEEIRQCIPGHLQLGLGPKELLAGPGIALPHG